MANGEQSATKQDLELFRGDLRGELAATEGRLVERIDDVESRLARRMDTLETHISARLDERLERMETRLLTGFEKWVNPINGRIRKLEVTNNLTEERLALIEERLRELKKRHPDNLAA